MRNGNHHSIYLQRAWNKYGEDNFEFKIIERCDKDLTLQREQYYLNLYQPYKNDIGYNMSQLASGLRLFGKENPNYGHHVSEENRKKLREVHFGKKLSEEHKQKIKNWYLTHSHPCLGQTGKLAPCYGRTGEKHPMYGIKGADHPSSKPVICVNTGRIFNSAIEASQWANCNYSKMCMCCRGERKSCGMLNGEKLQWKYIKKGEEQCQNT